MNEPEQERSGLSMALSALLGTGVGAAAGKYGSRFIPAIKKARDPNFLKEGGEGYNTLEGTKRQIDDMMRGMRPELAQKPGNATYTPSQEDLDGARHSIDYIANRMSNMLGGAGGVVGAGTGLALAPQHDVYEDPLR